MNTPSSNWKTALALAGAFAMVAANAGPPTPLPYAVVAPMASTVVYDRLPLAFEANRGQAGEPVRFLSRGDGFTLLVGSSETVLILKQPETAASARPARRAAPHSSTPSRVVRMKFACASSDPRVEGVGELPGRVNYFSGGNQEKWTTQVPTFTKVRCEQIYPGIDLVYYGNQRRLEYDLEVSPGADTSRILLEFSGVDEIELDEAGDLLLHVDGKEIRQHKPVVYQLVNGVRKEIDGSYRLRDGSTVGFQIGPHDKSLPVVIDPVLSYSTYLGGTGLDRAWDLAVDNLGNAYLAGETLSPNLPITTNAFQTNFTAGLGSIGGDAFVAKLNGTGTGFEYFTFLGGHGNDAAFSIAVDAAGNAFVCGYTDSTDFPTTANAFARTITGSPEKYFGHYPFDAFIAKLSPNGSSLLYSTYLGGDAPDQAIGVAVDGAGNIYAAGFSQSENFPITPGAFQPVLGTNSTQTVPKPADAFVVKFNPSLSGTNSLVYSTYLGGNDTDYAEGIAVDGAGSAYVAGDSLSTNFPVVGALQTTNAGSYDVFVTKLNPSGTALVYSTMVGGGAEDLGLRIAVDGAGSAFVTGKTSSTNFPVASAVQPINSGFADAFVFKLNAAGSALVYSTFLGGASEDIGWAIALDGAGNAFITGQTSSDNFPTKNAIQTTNALASDAFIVELDSTGANLLSSFLGGFSQDIGYGIAVDSAGSVYVAGYTLSSDFPTTTNTLQKVNGGSADAFVAKILVDSPRLTVTSTADSVKVSWAGPSPEFALEMAPDLHGPWAAVPKEPVLTGSRQSVIMPAGGDCRFFRLSRVK